MMCEWCNEQFILTRPNKRFCCRNCQATANHSKHQAIRNPLQRKCEHCGEIFIRAKRGGRKHRFCSALCQQQAYRGTKHQSKRKCRSCGVPLQPPRLRVCSARCKQRAWYKTFRKKSGISYSTNRRRKNPGFWAHEQAKRKARDAQLKAERQAQAGKRRAKVIELFKNGTNRQVQADPV